VVGVQFKLDGQDLGAEDTTAPYSIAWDTTTVSNGSHTLTAVAGDAAGNSAVSSGISVTVSNDDPPPSIYYGNPTNYLSMLSVLQPDDTLLLEPGIYDDPNDVPGLPVFNLNGTPDKPIIIKGPDTGPRPVFLGRSTHNTVRFDNASYVEVKNIEIDGRNLRGDGVNFQGVSHHITLDNLLIKGVGNDQGTVGISANRAPTWNITIRNSIVIGAGTGIYLGDSDGSNPFVNGIIENNLIVDTLGYNMQIKHQIPRPDIPGMPTGKSATIIRNNVFSKANNASGGDFARPNLLVGHFPGDGVGSSCIFRAKVSAV